MSKEIIAGVSVSENIAHLTVVEIRNRDIELLHLEEILRNSEDDFWYLDSILNPKIRLMKKISKVSVALDSTSVFLHSFPLDTTLNQSEQNEHIHWELGNLIPEYQAADYIYDMHILQTRAREQVAEVLVIAVKRSVISNLQKILSRRKLELHVADTNIIGTDHSLITNYPEVKIKNVALISINRKQVEIGLVSNGRLTKYSYKKDLSSGLIIQTLRGLQQDLPVVEAYFCGTSVSPAVIDGVKSAIGVNCILLNPFRRMLERSSGDQFNTYLGTFHRFAACTGLAIWRQ